ncbi:hypothetical protein MMC12_005792 [Toensbergia leucococca]|nr:hypothetical protein [Toensbergia leucococca]
MASNSYNQLTIAQALEMVRNNEAGDADQSAYSLLEIEIVNIWQRIQAQPTSYVMTKDEFAVFNYFRARYTNSDVARRAVARFWDHFQGNVSEIDGFRSP